MHPPIDAHDVDAPMFAADAFRLSDAQADLIEQGARGSASACWRRAPQQHDRDATFPIENFRDMRGEGLLSICIPKADGGTGADFQTYCIAAAELGRYCGATALSWNMHVCSTLWSGPLADDLPMSPEDRAAHNARRGLHYRRIIDDGAIYAQPFSEGGAAAAGTVAFGTEARPVEGGFIVNGKKIFASLSGAADYYGVLCTERAGVRGRQPAQHALSRHSRKRARRAGRGRLGSARHARNGVAHAAVQATCSCRRPRC